MTIVTTRTGIRHVVYDSGVTLCGHQINTEIGNRTAYEPKDCLQCLAIQRRNRPKRVAVRKIGWPRNTK